MYHKISKYDLCGAVKIPPNHVPPHDPTKISEQYDNSTYRAACGLGYPNCVIGLWDKKQHTMQESIISLHTNTT